MLLRRYRGLEANQPILLALNGDVFDVTAGRRFYGPDAGYKVFAGVDATRSLSLGSLDAADAALGKSHDLRDFDARPAAWDTLFEQHAFYGTKYGRVGRLVDAVGDDALYLLPGGSQLAGPLTKETLEQQQSRNVKVPIIKSDKVDL